MLTGKSILVGIFLGQIPIQLLAGFTGFLLELKSKFIFLWDRLLLQFILVTDGAVGMNDCTTNIAEKLD